jgi:hypothetical protein
MFLIGLSNHMGKVFAAPSTKNDPPFPGDWRARAEALLKNPKLETAEGEQMLENLSLELRRRWLQRAHLRSDGYMMSPPHSQRKLLPGDVRLSYPYDRWVKPQDLEHRLKQHRPAPQGWLCEARVFSSGMSALTTVLQVLRAFGSDMWGVSKSPLSLHWFGGYFEITKALEVLCDARFQGRKHAQQKNLHDAIAQGKPDIILIEPVAANIDLDVFDMQAFVAAWKLRPENRPCIIVLDTSLVGDSFPVEAFCHQLSDHPPRLVINIRSGLKLDQNGLELSNLGLMTLLTPNLEGHRERLSQLGNSLRIVRTTFGVNLSGDECAALSAPFVLDAQSLTNHSQAVFANNQRLGEALSQKIKPESGLFSQVIHPALGADKDKSWAVAPYVNLRYRSDDHSDRALLRAVIENLAFRRKLTFLSGSSFGFRAHRFEMGFIRGTKFSTLRIAMGARPGPSCDGVIALFEELADFQDMNALRAAYPAIAAKSPQDRTAEES